MSYSISRSGLTYFTRGLAHGEQKELRLSVGAVSLSDMGRYVLSYVADYVVGSRAIVLPGQTVQCGYWHLKFEPASDGYLDAWEYDAGWNEYQPGASLAAQYMREQSEQCKEAGEDMQAPPAHWWCMVSDGVLDGHPVDGARYPANDGHSGWWCTTELYNGDATTIKQVHLYHVTEAHPELARYLALPFGYWFDQRPGVEPYGFDVQIALDEPV